MQSPESQSDRIRQILLQNWPNFIFCMSNLVINLKQVTYITYIRTNDNETGNFQRLNLLQKISCKLSLVEC